MIVDSEVNAFPKLPQEGQKLGVRIFDLELDSERIGW